MNNPPPGSYCTDMAAEIDSPEEILADSLGIPLNSARLVLLHVENEVRKNQAIILARVIGLLLKASNLPAMAHAIAFASGLDQLNGAKSQAEVARELGVTRALLSHYTLGVRDVLSGKDSAFECTKFRKSQASRETFRAKATDPFTAAKAAAIAKRKNQDACLNNLLDVANGKIGTTEVSQRLALNIQSEINTKLTKKCNS